MKLRLGSIYIIVVTSVVLCSCHVEEPDLLFPRIEIYSGVSYEGQAKIYTQCDVKLTDTERHIMKVDGKIKLRGNSTSEFPKRPFTIKLHQETSLLGMPAASKWVLLANYFDKTMLRNALAFKMSEDSRLGWTPHFRFVELFYNGKYKGMYQLCEKVDVHPARVKSPVDGWLIEIDARVTESDNYFQTPHMENPFRIEWPDIPPATIAPIQGFVTEAEDALFSDHFTHPTEGWRKYLDEETWVDWYLINEIAKNCDGNLYSSCYMHLDTYSKIAMGPVWDYDTCFGNCVYEEPRNPEGFYIRNANWYTRLFEDPLFAKHVRERFFFFYQNKEKYYDFIRQESTHLRPAVISNDDIWHTIGVQISPYLEPCLSYDEDVRFLIDWLDTRLEWLKMNL